ncbi:hypothetical protein MNBD_DELTA04-1797 [hydrothermal vent metagenome]|uniref:HEAT repeat domain-containing protein n=1 Tax=hydrothermal vent metagenome TaxID=652676 RepID=A0A3B0W9A8_9ZZZZ
MTKPHKNTNPDDVNGKEAQAAGQVVLALNSAFKCYSLYPEDHSSSRNNLLKFKDNLDRFLAGYNLLRLDIDNNAFCYKGMLLSEGAARENNPAYLLNRDGVLWLEFFKGIELSEIKTLFSLLNQHKNAREVANGDIVTSLWQAHFPHILHEAADIFAMEAVQLDLSRFTVTRDQAGASADSAARDAPGAVALKIHGQPKVSTALPLSQVLATEGIALSGPDPREKAALKSLIEQEEKRNFNEDVIEVLLISLVVQHREIDFSAILEFLEEEFFATMGNGDFHLACKLCRNVESIRRHNGNKWPWVVPLIDHFFAALAKRERLAGLSWMKGRNGLSLHTENIEYLWPVLRLLPSEVLFTLGAMAAQTHSENTLINDRIRHEILEIIADKAGKNPEKFITLLAESDENVTLSLFPLIRQTAATPAAADIYLRLTFHPAVLVRRKALGAYLQAWEGGRPDRLAHLLNDRSPQIREKVLASLARNRNKPAEALLLDYLEKTQATQDDREYILQCYETLGRCGSARSVPLLQQVLLEKKWTGVFRNINDAHKQGAAFALKALAIPAAEKILNEGARSLWPDVRLACQRALEK